jgi:hypothetical protein
VPTILENLQLAAENYATQLAELSDPTKRRPNYTIGGRSVQWQAYQEWLLKQFREINAEIVAAGSEPVELVTAIE